MCSLSSPVYPNSSPVCPVDASTALRLDPERPRERETKEREMLEAALGALRSDGSVLVPSDTAGRVLETLLIFDHHWCPSVNNN